MTNPWDKPGVPQKGWVFVSLFDTRADGESVEDATYAECEMCGNEKIRFVHVMRHPEYPDELQVGCNCAERMAEDYVGPRERENEFKKRAGRRSRWLQRSWQYSANGNLYLKVEGYRLIVMADRYKAGKFIGLINGERINLNFDSEDEAKFALFEAAEKLKQT